MGENGGGDGEHEAKNGDDAEDAGDTSTVAKDPEQRRADEKARIADADGGSDSSAGGHTGDMARGTIEDGGHIREAQSHEGKPGQRGPQAVGVQDDQGTGGGEESTEAEGPDFGDAGDDAIAGKSAEDHGGGEGRVAIANDTSTEAAG